MFSENGVGAEVLGPQDSSFENNEKFGSVDINNWMIFDKSDYEGTKFKIFFR